MQLAVEMCPCSMSAIGFERSAMAFKNRACGIEWQAPHDVRDLFRFCLLVLLQFHGDILVNRSTTVGLEVVTVDAELQGSLFSIDDSRPWILRIRCIAPGAMSPDDVEIAVVEQGRLRVRYVGFGSRVDEDAAIG